MGPTEPTGWLGLSVQDLAVDPARVHRGEHAGDPAGLQETPH